MRTNVILFVGLLLPLTNACAFDYACATAEPQKSGWPLTDEEKAYVMKPEYERRPGREANKHLPQLWPSVPSAGNWGGTSWLDLHAKLVKDAEASKGPIDVLLVGDSITMQWGAAWTKHFPQLKTVNIGIGGDKTQNVLWRLDHGGVAGLAPRVVILLIGNNNMFFTPETGIEAAAQGIKVCAENLREKFPQAELVLVKIFPAHAPGVRFYEDIKKTNLALDALNLGSDPKIHVLDLWSDFTSADGSLKKGMFTPDNIHLTQDGGYALYADRLKPVLDALLNGRPVPAQPKTGSAAAPEFAPVPPAKPAATLGATAAAANLVVNSKPVLIYPYAPYNDGKMDEQLTGWPLTDAERAWVLKEEYSRKPGHEAQKHLPQFWAVTPTAGHWKPQDGSAGNAWLDHHAAIVEKMQQAAKEDVDILLIGDSITQGWGGGWDGAPFYTPWQRPFGKFKTINAGIGGDRTENILWRLDHGLLADAPPKVIVLMIGINNAPLVFANGVPAETVAQGIKLCADNLCRRSPKSKIVLLKILPAFDPAKEVGAKVREINAAFDALKPAIDARVHVLDLWRDFTNPEGALKTELYSDGHLHLSPAGYEMLAGQLQPLVEKLLTKP